MVAIFVILTVIILFFLLVMMIDGNRFKTREYRIENKHLSKECKVVVLSDLHNKQYGKENQKLIQAIDDMSPDLILCAGDMLTAKQNHSYEPALSLMKKLSEKYPIYYGIGNHEYRMKLYTEDYGTSYQKYKNELMRYGVKVLENESVTIDEYNICIQGVMIEKQYYKRLKTQNMSEEYLRSEIGTPNREKMQIFLAHNPDYFTNYVKAGADLVLSGHVHGGVMRLPILGGVVSPKCTLFPKYDGGLYIEGNGKMILSRGLGMHTIPIRIFNPGELIKVHLKPCK